MDIAWGNDSELSESEFYNRVEDINIITSLITANPNSTPTLLLTGIRGVGKTALMKNIKNKLMKEYLVIYMDISKSDAYQEKRLDRISFMQVLYDSIIDSCKEKGLKTIDKTLKKMIKTNDIHIADIANYEYISLPIITTEKNYSKFANFVMKLPQNIYRQHAKEIKGIIIFIDEFQILRNLENIDSFLWFLRSNIQENKNVTYILSGSMSLKDEFIEKIAGNEGAFGGRMLTLEIRTFSYETTKKYMQEKAPELKFTENGLKQFYKCTRGIPAYINIFANILPQNERLDENNIKYEFKRKVSLLATHNINLWSRLTLQEQKIITSLLEKPLIRKEIAEKLKVTTGSISKPLVKLKNMMMIEQNGKEYNIYDEIFKLWLKKYKEENKVYPYREI
ncbi:ATP-binding protein [Methanosphaera sp. BMS]|uniref:AAA family ATPase n=1 Tax=Methanosphaera sp. BMS TaxID=1789762 RepID=UPI000DC1C415|nr:ATP-binding protein [Methanosphaera sp. BMS]AWX33040.1 ATPase [Methanosphaera sp. BMS]